MSQANSVFYRGVIPASKSILNRLLILKSFAPGLIVEGDSDADDVMKMKSALENFSRGEPADCGAAGTTLRFLALRASRSPGTHHLSGSLRLFQRPQDEIRNVLSQFGCEVEIGPQRLTIRGDGWRIPKDGINIDRSVSSQFASGVVLSAWNLPEPLLIKFTGETVSDSYFQMTVKIAERAGMKIQQNGSELLIPAGATIAPTRMRAEIDTSSAFAVAALAVAHKSQAVFEHWPVDSLQPDTVFSEILKRMGCDIRIENLNEMDVLKVSNSGDLKAVEVDLLQSPDLFPVLGVLCAMANGRSKLFGAPHLEHKESNRIEKTAELLKLMGRKFSRIEGGLQIDGDARATTVAPSRYDTDHDHRLAMAAAVARVYGFPIEILQPQVVTKSFPGFWAIAQREMP